MNSQMIMMKQRALSPILSCVALILFGIGSAYAQNSNNLNYSRTSSFTYDPVSGLLLTETVEPTNPQLCVTTTYVYDSYGNKKSATTANCAGATGQALFTARANTSTYAAETATVDSVSVTAPAGTFQTNVANALNQSETKVLDPRFGNPLSLTGPNGLTTTWQVDDFGRTIRETHADGNSTVTYYCLITGRVSNTTSNSPNCTSINPPATEIPGLAVSFVHSEPHNSSDIKNGALTRVYMDAAGRKLRSVTEAFDGASQAGGASRFIVQDTDYNSQGAVLVSTQPYFLDSSSSTASGSGSYGMSTSVLDDLGRPVSVYTADPKGSQASIAFGSRGSYPATITTISYSGLATTTTNDQGQTRFEEKNIDGKVVRVTDATGAQIAYQYDAFGNLVETKDALQNLVTLSYDVRGHKLSMHDPDTGIWNYQYDALGELVWQQSPNQLIKGTTTTMAYDVLGRMTQRIEPEYTSNWTYDKYASGSACTQGIGKLCESSTTSGVDHLVVYDSLGRPLNQRTTVSYGPSFASAVSYNTDGRMISQTYPTGLSINYNYTAKGFLSTVTLGTAATVNPLPATVGGTRAASVSLAAGSVLWQAGSYNAWGKSEKSIDGNGIISNAVFDTLTGRVMQNTAGLTTSTTAMNYSYAWDSLSHLVGRTDANGDGTTGAVTDSFIYDSIGRLQNYTVSSPTIPALQRSVTMNYNAVGSLLFKSDVGVYDYPTQGSVQPHALQSLTGQVLNNPSQVMSSSYGYDANGNLVSATSGSYRTISYTSFNVPDSQVGIEAAGNTPQYTWQYDENHQRIEEIRVNSTGTRTTWMMHPDNAGGLGFESETDSNGIISNRHFLTVGGVSIGMLVSTGSLPTLSASQTAPTALANIILDEVEYWHKDPLGSLVSTSDQAGNVTARYEYDPFGKRRTASGQYDANGTVVIDWSDTVNNGDQRGYTGHQQLDDVGIVHMNGRTFDPYVGRFMQPDPLNQDPSNMQNFNRYGYCMNNPMTCMDPSGQSWLSEGIHDLTDDWHHIWHNPIARTAIIMVASYFTGSAAADWYASSVAATSGYVAGSSITAMTLDAGGVTVEYSSGTLYSLAVDNAAASIEGSMIQGAVSGFTSGLMSSNGNLKAGFQGATSGAALGAFNSWQTTTWNLADSDQVTVGEIKTAGRTTNWVQVFEKTLAESMTQGAIYAAFGKSFKTGFQSDILSSSLYEVYMAYTPWRPQTLGTTGVAGGKLDASNPLVGDDAVASYEFKNNFGGSTLDGAPLPGWSGLIKIQEGSPISSFLTQFIPGMDAISKIHDDWATTFQWCQNTACYSTMLPAAVVSYGALNHQLGH